MKKFFAIAATITILGVGVLAEKNGAKTVKNVVVYQQEGRFGGWPANHGMWAWGDEIVAGFEAGHYKHSERSHAIDYSRPAEHLLARSLDGGETWKLEKTEGSAASARNQDGQCPHRERREAGGGLPRWNRLYASRLRHDDPYG